MDTDLIRRYDVIGSRRISNYFWVIIIGLGSLDFLLTGLSSYFHFNLLPIIHSENIIFFSARFSNVFLWFIRTFF